MFLTYLDAFADISDKELTEARQPESTFWDGIKTKEL